MKVSENKRLVDEMQRVVSLIGAHRGNVIIFKDENLPGKSNLVPTKPSFFGAHVFKRLFQLVHKINGANTNILVNNTTP